MRRLCIPLLVVCAAACAACGTRDLSFTHATPPADAGPDAGDAGTTPDAGEDIAQYFPADLAFHAKDGVAIAHGGGPDSEEAFLAGELGAYLYRIGGDTAIPREGVSSGAGALITLGREAGPCVRGSYRIASSDTAAGKAYDITSCSSQGLAYGTYHFLELLGVRFFHPRHEFVPRYPGVRLPASVSIAAAPALVERIWHVHTLHPIEYQPFLMEPAASHAPHAREMITWLLKTRQNGLNFYAMDNVDMAAWIPYMTELLGFARRWDVKLKPIVILWGGSSLQHAYTLVESETGWRESMEARVDALFQAPWDGLVVAFGEFIASDAERTLEWIDHLTAYVSDRHPGAEIAAEIHVGKYDSTTIDFRGETMLYYFLPKFADPRLSVLVHTVMFHNLYDPAWGTYGHADFSEHREFLLSQLGKRGVLYHPESAYWCTFDVDVGLFLPVYVESRVRELERLIDDVAARGSGPLMGASLFSSGHEWGYWLTDYTYARATYLGKQGLDAHLRHAAAPFGRAAGRFAAWLGDLTARQKEWFLDKNLIPYLSGEDIADDVGWAMGIATHPKRLQFRDMAAMDKASLKALRDGDIATLGVMADLFDASADEAEVLGEDSPAEALPWLHELATATRMLAVRSRHQKALYEAVIAALLGDSRGARQALNLTGPLQEAARAITRKMEAGYRYGSVEYLHYQNNTIYPFGYLGQTGDLCFWKRQLLQAQGMVFKGAEPGVSDLPTCAN